MTARFGLLIFFSLAVAACSKESAPTTSMPENAESARPEPVVVYAVNEDGEDLQEVFADFTRDTGIRVTVKYADASSIVSNVINDHGSPPADVLLTPSVLGVWKAADEGGLRPFMSETLIRTIHDNVPEHLRDPDGSWVAVGVQVAAIAYDSRVIDASVLQGYDSLAEQNYRGQLCLSSSSLAVNRSLISMLIDERGVRPAEILVRGWKDNLALPVFKTERDLLSAIAGGECVMGIVSSSATTAASMADGSTQFFVPQSAYFDVNGVGVARHAREPESAQRLIEWYLVSKAANLHSDLLSTRNIGIAAWRAEDAVKLAERAGYR